MIMGGDCDHRWTQAREAVLALQALWTQEETELHRHYYDFPPAHGSPTPAQQLHPLVLLGGHAPTGSQRVARYADGWLPHRITPHEVEASRKRLHSLAAERGRDPAALTIAVFGQ